MPAGDYSIGSAHWPGLAKVSEECSEVTRLEDELADTCAAITFLLEANPVLDPGRIAERGAAKLALFRRWHAEHADHSAGR